MIDLTPEEPPMSFTEAQQRTWTKLYGMLEPRIEKYACREYLDGFAGLAMARDHIPTVEELNARIKPATGWQVVRTSVRYSDAVEWYKNFAKKCFLITDYIREESELEFTPEPDMFHDVFGHLPFLMDQPYADLEEIYAPTFLRVGDDDREKVKRLAWYSTEFGMIRENGEMKVFGAGLLSSAGEMDRVAAGEVPIQEFVCEDVVEHAKSVWEFNSVLFVADSVEAYHRELKRYFDAMPDRES
jgi:phenylalanine-4-hydroxylase